MSIFGLERKTREWLEQKIPQLVVYPLADFRVHVAEPSTPSRIPTDYQAIVVDIALVLCLVLHLTLGYRRLRDMRYYSDDPLVMRTLGLSRLPDVATLSRGLARADAESAQRLQRLVREGVVTRLVALGLSRDARATLETLATIKNPQPVAFVRQANIARTARSK